MLSFNTNTTSIVMKNEMDDNADANEDHDADHDGMNNDDGCAAEVGFTPTSTKMPP